MKYMNILARRCFNSSFVQAQKAGGVSLAASDLKGRDLVSLSNLTTGDITTVLWAAIDLKKRNLKEKTCDGKSICMISDDPIRRISLSNAATRLGASVAFLSSSELSNDGFNLESFGKTLGTASDVVFIDTEKLNQEKAETIATGSSVPVISVRTEELAPIVCLSELMTIFEHYQYLRRIIISYVGKGSDPILNTYALLLPKVGMHLHFLIDGQMNGDVWQRGLRLSLQSSTEFKEFDNLADTIFRSHVISTCPNNRQDFFLALKDTEEMDLDWTVLHSSVYKSNSISEELMKCKQSLIWEAVSNLTWIFQAVIATTTMGYKPVCERPGFEGVP